MSVTRKRPAPYRHADGSNCWTRGCGRGASRTVETFEMFLQQAESAKHEMDPQVHAYIMETLEREGEFEKPGYNPRVVAIRNLIEKNWRRYGQPMVGRTRAVWDLGDGRVMKIAFTDEGAFASNNEYRAAKDPEKYVPVASCEWEVVDGVDVLLMEKVDPITKIDYKKLPHWVGFVDCAQVGYTFDGRLVAYDL